MIWDPVALKLICALICALAALCFCLGALWSERRRDRHWRDELRRREAGWRLQLRRRDAEWRAAFKRIPAELRRRMILIVDGGRDGAA